MQIDTVVYFQITDPKLYTYGVERPVSAIENLTATTLRNIIGDLELDHTLTSRDVINTKIRVILDEATDAWGIKTVSYTHLHRDNMLLIGEASILNDGDGTLAAVGHTQIRGNEWFLQGHFPGNPVAVSYTHLCTAFLLSSLASPSL